MICWWPPTPPRIPSLFYFETLSRSFQDINKFPYEFCCLEACRGALVASPPQRPWGETRAQHFFLSPHVVGRWLFPVDLCEMTVTLLFFRRKSCSYFRGVGGRGSVQMGASIRNTTSRYILINPKPKPETLHLNPKPRS